MNGISAQERSPQCAPSPLPTREDGAGRSVDLEALSTPGCEGPVSVVSHPACGVCVTATRMG